MERVRGPSITSNLLNAAISMNVSMVVLGDPKQLDQVRGTFIASVSGDDFTSSGTMARTTSRGFNLLLDAGAARIGHIHFLVVRLTDNLRAEGFVECVPNARNCASISVPFASPAGGNSHGKIEGTLHWDGSMGILTTNWTVPRE
jgi:hypothetical protein